MKTMTNKERVAFFTEKLGGVDSRLLINWIIKDVKASDSNNGNGAYVRVTLDNLNGWVSFDDLRELERKVKAKVRGAFNFAIMKSSMNKPKFSFCV